MSSKLGAILVLLSVVAGSACVAESRGSALPYYADRLFTPTWNPVAHSVTTHVASDTPFLDQTGSAFTPSSLRGTVHVVSFIFTRCASICPPLVSSLKKVQAATAGAPVTLVSYSVDPTNDSVPVLREFAVSRGIDSARWKLLTGSVNGVHQVARDLYFADDDGMRKSLADPETFLHTEKVLLIDRGGHIRGLYNGTQPFEIQKLIEDLSVLGVAASAR
jgi:protein SCO1/2